MSSQNNPHEAQEKVVRRRLEAAHREQADELQVSPSVSPSKWTASSFTSACLPLPGFRRAKILSLRMGPAQCPG